MTNGGGRLEASIRLRSRFQPACQLHRPVAMFSIHKRSALTDSCPLADRSVAFLRQLCISS